MDCQLSTGMSMCPFSTIVQFRILCSSQSTSPRIATIVLVRVPRGCAGQFGPHYSCTVPMLFKCGLTLKYHSSRAKKIPRFDPRWAYAFWRGLTMVQEPKNTEGWPSLGLCRFGAGWPSSHHGPRACPWKLHMTTKANCAVPMRSNPVGPRRACAVPIRSRQLGISASDSASPNWMVICHDQSWCIMINHDKSPDFIMKNHQ